MNPLSDPPEMIEGKWGVFFLVAIAVFMSTLDGSIVNIALPAVMKDLKVPLTTIEWIPLIYLLTISSLLLPLGRLSDIKGRRWVYCRGFIIFTVGSFLCGSAGSALWLIAARSFQGIGAAMLMACSPALVVDIFPASERGRALGMIGTVVAAGLTIGPALGGFIVQYLSWRSIFYINIPIGLFATVCASRALMGGRGDVVRQESFDWPGAFFLTISFIVFITGVTRFQNLNDTIGFSCLLMAVAVGSAVWFFHIEKRTAQPIFDPALLQIRLFTMPVLSAMILFMGLFTMVFLMPFYLVHPCGFTMNKAGMTMMIPFVFFFVISPLSGSLSDRIGSRLLCSMGMLGLSVGLFALAGLTPDSAYGSVVWRLSLVGIGAATFISPNSAAALGSIPPPRRGIASGMVATARNLGMVIGVALAGLVFNSIFYSLTGGLSLKEYLPEMEPSFMTAFKYAMMSGGMVTAVGSVVSYFRGPDHHMHR